MHGVTHRHADLRDVRLHYVSAGEGFPAVMLHGWPRSWYERRRMIPGLAAKYRVIAPDLCGPGDRSWGRRMEVVESLRRMATDARGGVIENRVHRVPEEQPAGLPGQLLRFFAGAGGDG